MSAAKKEYLEAYARIKSKLNVLKEQLEELEESKDSISIQYSDMPKACNSIDLSGYLVKVEQIEQQILQQRYYLVCRFQQIKNVVDKIEDETEQAVLTYRYLRNLKWETICDKMGYSWKQIHRIHTRAVDHLLLQEEDIE